MKYYVANYKEKALSAEALERRRANHREYIRKKYHDDAAYRKRHLRLVAKGKERLKDDVRRLIAAFKKNGCSICGENELCCLSAHHRDPSKKSFSVGTTVGRYSRRKIVIELRKCICLCENCHRKVHAGIVNLPK